MKLIRLSLSDSAYGTALALAAEHGIPLESYISGQVEDLLDNNPVNTTPSLPLMDKPAGPQPSLSTIMPDTLRQVIEVSAYVYRTRNVPSDETHARTEFWDAVRTVAKQWKIGESSVRDKCCTSRRLGLPDVKVNTDKFIGWLCKPELLRDHLCRKFPNCVEEIHRRFAELLPGKFD